MKHPGPRPRLTDRILQGIIDLDMRGGREREECLDVEGYTKAEWDRAEAALLWAHRMKQWLADMRSYRSDD